jgi:streptogramin lyase
MKKNILVSLLLSLLFATACTRQFNDSPVIDSLNENASERAAVALEGAGAKIVIAADQLNERLVMIDLNHDNRETWEWKAAEDPNVLPEHAKWFINLDECKPVFDGKYLITTASGGGVGLIHIASRKAVWYGFAGGNAHSAEVLPDGNIVSASTTGNYLTLFVTDPEDTTHRSIKYDFPDVHNCTWDKTRELLWCAGKNRIRAYKYNNDRKNPALTLFKTVNMPQGNAHDLFPVYGSTDELWLSNSSHIYRYNITRNKFTEYKTSAGATIASVKSIQAGPEGYVTFMDQANGIGGESWRTDRLTDFDGNIVYQNDNVGIYKARYFLTNSFSYPDKHKFQQIFNGNGGGNDEEAQDQTASIEENDSHVK